MQFFRFRITALFCQRVIQIVGREQRVWMFRAKDAALNVERFTG